MVRQAKEQSSSEEEQPAEQSQVEHSHAEFEDLKARYADLRVRHDALQARHDEHETRLAELEKHVSSAHALEAEAVDHIAKQAADHAIKHVHKVFGHSGLPARGDQG